MKPCIFVELSHLLLVSGVIICLFICLKIVNISWLEEESSTLDFFLVPVWLVSKGVLLDLTIVYHELFALDLKFTIDIGNVSKGSNLASGVSKLKHDFISIVQDH